MTPYATFCEALYAVGDKLPIKRESLTMHVQALARAYAQSGAETEMSGLEWMAQQSDEELLEHRQVGHKALRLIHAVRLNGGSPGMKVAATRKFLEDTAAWKTSPIYVRIMIVYTGFLKEAASEDHAVPLTELYFRITEGVK